MYVCMYVSPGDFEMMHGLLVYLVLTLVYYT